MFCCVPLFLYLGSTGEVPRPQTFLYFWGMAAWGVATSSPPVGAEIIFIFCGAPAPRPSSWMAVAPFLCVGNLEGSSRGQEPPDESWSLRVLDTQLGTPRFCSVADTGISLDKGLLADARSGTLRTSVFSSSICGSSTRPCGYRGAVATGRRWVGPGCGFSYSHDHCIPATRVNLGPKYSIWVPMPGSSPYCCKVFA
jgi:hypothetical protein